MFLEIFLVCAIFAFCVVTTLVYACLLVGGICLLLLRLLLWPLSRLYAPRQVIAPTPQRTLEMHGVEYADGQRQFIVHANDYRRHDVTPR